MELVFTAQKKLPRDGAAHFGAGGLCQRPALPEFGPARVCTVSSEELMIGASQVARHGRSTKRWSLLPSSRQVGRTGWPDGSQQGGARRAGASNVVLLRVNLVPKRWLEGISTRWPRYARSAGFGLKSTWPSAAQALAQSEPHQQASITLHAAGAGVSPAAR